LQVAALFLNWHVRDAQGVSQFYQLLSRKAEAVFYAFGLLWLNGEDLRNQPLTTRKETPRPSNPIGPTAPGFSTRSISSSMASDSLKKFAAVTWKASLRNEN